MENEIDSASNLGVTMIALAALIVLVMFTVGIGLSVKKSSLEEFDNINRDTKSSALVELEGTMTEMSVASAYQIILNAEGSIEKIDYYMSEDSGNRDKISEIIDDMGKNLTGRCQVEVHRVATGGYDIKLHTDRCFGICTCYD